jgi:hypothetical protein
MKVSKKRTAIAIELRDCAMKIIRHFEPDLTNMRVTVDSIERAGFSLVYSPMRTHGHDHYLYVGAIGMSEDGFPRSVMNIYWNERGDVHVSRFIPGKWEAILRAEGELQQAGTLLDGITATGPARIAAA